MSGYFQSSKIRKAQKAHKCYLCKMPIGKGESYWHSHGSGEYGFYDTKLHLTCDALVERYCDATGECEWDDDTVLEWLSDTVCGECTDNEDCPFSFHQTPHCPTIFRHFNIGGEA